MTVALILALALALSFCVGLGSALVVAADAGKPAAGAQVAWIDWIPGTPPPVYNSPGVNSVPLTV